MFFLKFFLYLLYYYVVNLTLLPLRWCLWYSICVRSSLVWKNTWQYKTFQLNYPTHCQWWRKKSFITLTPALKTCHSWCWSAPECAEPAPHRCSGQARIGCRVSELHQGTKDLPRLWKIMIEQVVWNKLSLLLKNYLQNTQTIQLFTIINKIKSIHKSH